MLIVDLSHRREQAVLGSRAVLGLSPAQQRLFRPVGYEPAQNLG